MMRFQKKKKDEGKVRARARPAAGGFFPLSNRANFFFVLQPLPRCRDAEFKFFLKDHNIALFRFKRPHVVGFCPNY